MTNQGTGDNIAFRSIWYADRARAESKWKYLVYDAKGDLFVDPAKLRFSGDGIELSIGWADVTGVDIRKQAFASSLSLCFVGAASLFGLANGAMSARHPVLYAVAGVLFYPAAYLLIGSSAARSAMKSWTVVSYRAAGRDGEAWFTGGAKWGWKDRTGKTRICMI